MSNISIGYIIRSLKEDRVRIAYAKKGRLIPHDIYMEVKNRKHCKICGRSKRKKERFEVDHKIPRSKGGGNNIENLQALCHQCHKRKTEEENNVSYL